MATIRDSAGGRKSSRACAELEGLDTRVAVLVEGEPAWEIARLVDRLAGQSVE